MKYDTDKAGEEEGTIMGIMKQEKEEKITTGHSDARGTSDIQYEARS